jgi:hypothetical protein
VGWAVGGDFELVDGVGGGVGFRGADGIALLPRSTGWGCEPGFFEVDFGSGVGGVNADVEVFAGVDAARGFVGAAAAEAGVFDLGGFGGEGDEVEAEEVFEGGLELGDFGVELKEYVDLCCGVEIGCCNP